MLEEYLPFLGLLVFGNIENLILSSQGVVNGVDPKVLGGLSILIVISKYTEIHKQVYLRQCTSILINTDKYTNVIRGRRHGRSRPSAICIIADYGEIRHPTRRIATGLRATAWSAGKFMSCLHGQQEPALRRRHWVLDAGRHRSGVQKADCRLCLCGILRCQSSVRLSLICHSG